MHHTTAQGRAVCRHKLTGDKRNQRDAPEGSDVKVFKDVEHFDEMHTTCRAGCASNNLEAAVCPKGWAAGYRTDLHARRNNSGWIQVAD
jgi:hypothetical protein